MTTILRISALALAGATTTAVLALPMGGAYAAPVAAGVSFRHGADDGPNHDAGDDHADDRGVHHRRHHHDERGDDHGGRRRGSDD